MKQPEEILWALENCPCNVEMCSCGNAAKCPFNSWFGGVYDECIREMLFEAAETIKAKMGD